MTNKATLYASTMLVIATSCSAAPSLDKAKALMDKLPPYMTATSAARCKGDTDNRPCVHIVTVEKSGDTCKVAVVPDIMVVSYTGHPVRIEWRIDTAGYKFVENEGIHFKEQSDIKGPSPQVLIPPEKQFKDVQRVGDRKYQAIDANTMIGAWLYDVRVTDGARTCTLDPPIVNDF